MTMKACILDSRIFRVFPEVIVPDAYDNNIEIRPTLITINHDHILKTEKVLIKKSVVFIDKLKIAQEVRDKAVEDGQRMGEALLYAEAKMGELLKQIPRESGKRTDLQPCSDEGTRLEGTGISRKQRHYAEILADNPEEIRETIKEIRDLVWQGLVFA
jgi:hypothetical protein